MKNYLNFETDIKDLESEIEKLKDPYNQGGLSEVDTKKISKSQKEIDEKLKEIYSNLDPWQTTLVARHEDRPKAKFFIDNLFEDFIPLSGDRFYGEDRSVLVGFAKFNEKSVLVIGQEKGDSLESRIDRNFGMMRPEGYRKTTRLMNLADKFNIPLIFYGDNPAEHGNNIEDNFKPQMDLEFYTGEKDYNKIILGGVSAKDLINQNIINIKDLNPYLPTSKETCVSKDIQVHYLSYYLM